MSFFFYFSILTIHMKIGIYQKPLYLSANVVEILFEEGFFAFSFFPSIQLLYAWLSSDNYNISKETGHTAGTHSSPSSSCCQTFCKWADSWASIIRIQCSLTFPSCYPSLCLRPRHAESESLAPVVSHAFHLVLEKKLFRFLTMFSLSLLKIIILSFFAS